ncbi:hypothetical protein Pyn_26473 [Prunus yedoensis var. nudiflora]|uniref:Uncharacterized protein n=1 Tax=Prunus yedoensis var. nudiflora TaxID=2094558 RepID=A0A314V036_PRUYE|nr:hypothetical protein Pyn_26473 [Prunus yedoensis var. nudiflora]
MTSSSSPMLALRPSSSTAVCSRSTTGSSTSTSRSPSTMAFESPTPLQWIERGAGTTSFSGRAQRSSGTQCTQSPKPRDADNAGVVPPAEAVACVCSGSPPEV